MIKTSELHRLNKEFRAEPTVKFGMIVLLCLVFLSSAPSWGKFGSIVDIGVAGDLYLTNESANNGQGFVNLLIQNTWSESQLWVDVGAGGLVGDRASSYIKAPQFYYRLGKPGKTQVVLGRYRHRWSALDRFWNMGLTQPIFKWNEADPEPQGLTGLFFTTPLLKNRLELMIFGSLLYIPTQGPSFDITDGEITSSNPWFNDPVQILNLDGERAKLNYQLNIPRTQDVVAKDRQSFGIQVATPMNRKGLQANVFYMDKPRNDLILPFEGSLNLTTFNGDITINPQVARHQVGGVDVGWNFARFKTLFSWVYESSVTYAVPSNSTFPVIPQQNIFSFQQLFRVSRSQRIWLGYLRADRQANGVGGAFANAQISTYLYRNRFENAVRLKWEGLLFKSLNKYRLRASFSYTQNLEQDNLWLSSDLKWAVYKGFELFNRCDFFGGRSKIVVGTDFISAYQNNDRCLVGGHYAF